MQSEILESYFPLTRSKQSTSWKKLSSDMSVAVVFMIKEWNHKQFPSSKNSHFQNEAKGAQSICQNWPAGPLQDQSVWKWNRLFQEFLLKNHLFRTYHSGFDWSGWIVSIKSEILVTTGRGWPVSFDKWKRPVFYFSAWEKNSHFHISGFTHSLALKQSWGNSKMAFYRSYTLSNYTLSIIFLSILSLWFTAL